MRVIEITPPAEEPVSLAEQKLHSRIDHTADDTLIPSLITSARKYCESLLRRSFVSTTWEVSLDRFPRCPARIDLPRQSVIEVVSVKYIEPDGDEITLDPSDYTVVTGTPGYVVPAYGVSWPSSRCHPDSVKVRFTAGYGDASDVPASLKTAVKMVAAHLYEHREASTETNLNTVPMAVDSLLSTEEYGFYS